MFFSSFQNLILFLLNVIFQICIKNLNVISGVEFHEYCQYCEVVIVRILKKWLWAFSAYKTVYIHSDGVFRQWNSFVITNVQQRNFHLFNQVSFCLFGSRKTLHLTQNRWLKIQATILYVHIERRENKWIKVGTCNHWLLISYLIQSVSSSPCISLSSLSLSTLKNRQACNSIEILALITSECPLTDIRKWL